MSKKWKTRKATPEELKMFGAGDVTPQGQMLSETGGEAPVAETFLDVLKTMPQSASLEMADEAISAINPQWGDQYREMVKEARQRSPIATTIGEIFTPDPISKIGLGAKVLKHLPTDSIITGMAKQGARSAAEGAATSAAIQAGTTGEVDPWETAISTAISGGAGAAAGALANYSAMRAKTTGTDREIDAFDLKAEKGGQVDYMNNLMSDLDKNFNLFQGGKVKIDPETLKFVPETKTVTGGKIIPPSKKELLQRVEQQKKLAMDKAKKLLNEQSQFSFSGLEGFDDYAVSSGKGFFTKEDFSEGITDIVESISTKSDKEKEKLRKALEYQLEQTFGKGAGEANFLELNDLKQRLHGLVNYSRDTKSPAAEDAYKKMATLVRNTIEDNLEGSVELKSLNKLYGDLSVVSDGLVGKIKGGDPTKMKSGMLAGNIGYKIASGMEAARDTLLDPVSQISATLQQTGLGTLGETAMRKAAPIIFRQDESESPAVYRGPDAASAAMSLPKQLIKTTLPRTTEGLIQNKKLLLAKIAQQHPEMFEEMQLMVEDDTRMKEFLPLLIERMPHLFEKDRYNRIDNIVPEDKKPFVMEEIRKSGLPSTEMIRKLDLLNRTGEYYDT